MFIQVCFNDDPRERVGPKWEGVEFLYWNGINTKKVKNRILKHPYKKLSLMFNLIFFYFILQRRSKGFVRFAIVAHVGDVVLGLLILLLSVICNNSLRPVKC